MVSAAGVCVVCVIVSGSRIKPEKQRRVIPDWSSHTLQDSNLRSDWRAHTPRMTLFSSFLFERERNTRHLSAQGGIIEPNVCVLWERAHTHTHRASGTFIAKTRITFEESSGTFTLPLLSAGDKRDCRRNKGGWNKKKTNLMRRTAEFDEEKSSVRGDAGSARRFVAGARSPVTGESAGIQVRTLIRGFLKP